MRLLPAVLLASLTSCSVSGQTYTISTFAGGGMAGGVNAVAADAGGNVYFVSGSNMVFRLSAQTGLITLVAGNGTGGVLGGFSGDNGPASAAQLSEPQGVAVDSAGNVYIADVGNHRIRKVANGVITTVAGYGTPGFSGDGGPATSAQLAHPYDVSVDSAGNLYIADYDNQRIRKVSNGVITTVAGNGTAGFSGDNGPATSAQLNYPMAIAVDASGNIFVADYFDNRVRKVSNGVITTVAGSGTPGGFSGDGGPATSAQLNNPNGVAVDSAGNLYISDYNNKRIRKVANGVITTVAGNGTAGFSGDGGPATSAQLSCSCGVAVDSAGNFYIADGDRIRKVSSGTISTVAGNGNCCFAGDGGPATGASFFQPIGVALDSAGGVYISDKFLNRIRKVSNGVITTVAGNGTAGPAGDNGPAITAQLNQPTGVVVDSAGNLYVADWGNNRVRKVSNGVITTVAGIGPPGFSGDNGPATSAQLALPTGVAVDSAGNLYIADYNNRIREVSNGVITTIAGNGTAGFSNDNGPATSAQLNSPAGVAVDASGNLFIADLNNNRVRKVSNGVITTVAGNGTTGFSGDGGPATIAELGGPFSVAADPEGNLYIADEYYIDRRIRLLTLSAGPPPPFVTALKNVASNLSGPIAPGEIVVLTGSGLGPSQITSAAVGTDGLYDPQLAGTSVQFNGIAAPMIYTSATQAAAIVPYEVTGASAQVAVTYQGQTSVTVAVAASAPGLFTQDSSGGGQAAAVNQDGSVNTPSTPARIGSVISLFATGEGQTLPPGSDGTPASGTPPTPILPVNVTIGGVTVNELQYVGGAPGEVAGLLQINVQIPASVTPGSAVPVLIRVGGATSQSGVTIAVSAN